MNDKIKAYITRVVDQQSTQEETDELIEELTSNSILRYEDYRQQGFTTEEAYRKTISHLGDFSTKENGRQEFFPLFGLILFIQVFINLVLFLFYESETKDVLFILNVLMNITLIGLYFYQSSKNEEQDEITWKKKTILVYQSTILLSLLLFRYYSPFLASGTYAKHTSEYIIYGLFIGFAITSIVSTTSKPMVSFKQQFQILPKELLMVTGGVALFSMIDYFDMLRSGEYIVFMLLLSIVMLSVAGVGVYQLIYKKERVFSIYTIMVVVVGLIELWTTSLYDSSHYTAYSVTSQYLIVIPLVIRIILAFVHRIDGPTIITYTIQLFLTLLMFELIIHSGTELYTLMHSTSLSASIPHTLKLRFNTMVILMWFITIFGSLLQPKTRKILFTSTLQPHK